MFVYLKFMYSEKATKFCEISTVDLSYVVPVKSTVEISQNFGAFSEHMNFKKTAKKYFGKTHVYKNQNICTLRYGFNTMYHGIMVALNLNRMS